MSAYYNEHDRYCAAWLRNLIAADLIAPGEVDERSIEDVAPGDLVGFRQCHFFAGIGVWSYALRRAGWPDDRPVWTGSCPCQPFSAAGKGAGFADERHLWPAFFWLIEQCRPATILGEQVGSDDGLAWFDLVRADLDHAGYTAGALDTCAAGFGAPHIRQRLYWLAHTDLGAVGQHARELSGDEGQHDVGPAHRDHRVECGGADGRLADPASEQRGARRLAATSDEPGAIPGLARPRADGGLADAGREAAGLGRGPGSEGAAGHESGAGPGGCGAAGGLADTVDGLVPQARARADGRIGEPGDREERAEPGPTNGLWRDADWLFCRDGRWRPARPGSFPLVTGAPARMGRLRAYGNACNVAQAEGFVRAAMECVQ